MGTPPAHLEALEFEKSRLLFEAHLLKAQQRYTEAADLFTQVADIEHQWVQWAEAQSLDQLELIHRRSEASCWAQAGYPHRAIQLIDRMLALDTLNQELRDDLSAYRDSLQYQFVNWMNEWVKPALQVA